MAKEALTLKNRIEWDYPSLGEGIVPAEAKINALLHFALHGSISAAAEYAGVDPRTVSKWKSTAVWWDAEISKVRRAKTDELDGKFSKIIDNALKEMEDRVENGDSRLDKYGELKKVPMTGRDLVMLAAIVFDKQRLLRGEATTISGKPTTLEDLMSQFEKMSSKSTKGATPNGDSLKTDA